MDNGNPSSQLFKPTISEEGYAGLEDSFSFEVIIDDIRVSTEEETINEQFAKAKSVDCGSDCCC